MKNIKIRFQTQSNISWFVFITVAFVDYFNPFFSSQVFKGEDGAFQISGLQSNTDYRFRVGACRRCQDTCQELCGPLSPSSLFTLRRQESASSGDLCPVDGGKGTGLISSDERFAALIVCAFAGFSILIACLLQYFFMKWGNSTKKKRIEREKS